jgi:Family of unknown function (DUF6786)
MRFLRFVLLGALTGCGQPAKPPETRPVMNPSPTPSASTPTFDEDVAFLNQHGATIVLESPGGGRVAVSPKYQGRVMTSAVAPGGPSLGFVHRTFITKGQTGTAFDNYGGEDRFWLGPEAGPFGLYFPRGAPFVFDKWQTPPSLQEGEWPVKERSPDSVLFERAMKVTNYAGTTFELAVTRTVRLLSAADVAARAGGPLPSGVKWVAFETENKITNTGKAPWTKASGLLSVWILGMYTPGPDTRVVIPFEKNAAASLVNDRYFGKVPAERLVVRDGPGVILFTCDGKYRSKIGLGPARAKPVLGSYSRAMKLLTLVRYDKPEGASDYVNSMWEKQREPFAGDVVNSYNDGPTEPGKASLGGFYELETSSPAAALAPGASLVHTHTTIHLSSDETTLDPIARRTLGTPLAETMP